MNSKTDVRPTHLLSFDIEHWYEGYRYRGGHGWESIPPRDPAIVTKILHAIASTNNSATFFCTGRFCRDFPDIVKAIAASGNELASHSYEHRLVTDFTTEKDFVADLRKSLSIIEDTTGSKVIGYRAPKWSIPRSPTRFYELLQSEGLLYDSSLFPSSKTPGRHTLPFQAQVCGRTFWEFPATALQVGPFRLPAAGGLWLRLWPNSVSHMAIRQKVRQNSSAMVYLHPYDLDPDCPRLPGFGWQFLPFYFARHHALRTSEAKLNSLLINFRFTSIQKWLETFTLPSIVQSRPF